MSINVTVSGNPVSINRGKMVTTDSYQSKKDFERRRLMRIQQVRQQSKDIAEDVRNKVQREKKKQMGLIEKEGKEKHKNWQNRKLLELQTQYKEALNDIGVGYKDAESITAQEQKEVAEKQGKIKEQDLAAKKRILKEKSERKSQEQMKKPKYVPNPVVKRRSPMKTPKIKKKKTPSASINISIPSNSSSDSKENVELIDVTSQPDEASSCTCEEKESESDVVVMEKDTPSSESIKDFNLIEKETQKLKSPTKKEEYYDSRISERIKRRDIMTNHPDYCEEFAKTDPVTLPESNTKIRNVIYNRNLTDKSEHVCSCDNLSFYKCNCCCRIAQGLLDEDSKHEKDGIPQKPKLKLKKSDEKVNVPKASATKLSQASLDSNKVTYYDHNTRYEGKKSTSSLVKKILPDNFELQPNDGIEQDYFEKMRQRDREAIMRSNKVLEKEKIHKDYNEIMKKLPLLQKQERLARLNTDKPEYHMNEDRLKQLEQKKQNQLENAFLRKIPIIEPKIVTLPIRNNESNINGETSRPFDSQPCNKESAKSDNVGEWNQDSSQKLFTAEEVQNIVKAFSEPTYQDRKSKFKELLHNLKLQKKQLIEEIKLLPKDQSVLEMLKDLDEFSSEDTQKQNRKKVRSEKRKKKNPRDELYTVSEESELETDKRPRSKPKILIRQNISTQTTPVSKDRIIQVNGDDLTEEKNKLPEQNKKSTVRLDENVDDVGSKPICKLQHIPCNCQPDKDETSDKLEIVIQFNENDQPQVVVKDKSPETSDKNKSDDTQKSHNQSEELPHLKKKKSKSTNRSWKEQFSKNSSASTSYFSPPDLEEMLKNGKFTHFYEKPQQSNISSTVPEPNLLNCIDKLLNMNRNNIDNLTVSSSSVTTPNQSVVEIETNIPPNPVNDVYKLMTKYLTEARKNLSFSQDDVNWSQASNPDTCCDVPLCPTNLKTKGPSDESKFKAAQGNTLNDVQYSYYDDYAKEYAAITDSTSRKIETLAAMIQKLREEKNKIIDISTASNKSDLNGQKEDFSTAYMELSGGSSKSSSNSHSLNEEEINTKLLHVDMDLANKLRKRPENPEPENTALFVPLLSDIPKLPKFQLCEETCGETRTKPPPSKGLSIAKKFNDISLIPHELSVIVESESQLSSKLDTSKNANASKGSNAFHSLPNESDVEKSVQIVCDNKTGGEKSIMQSSSSSDDLESLESMLRSIGMEWAIPTLHKTKEALALTASTSSDSSLKLQPGRKNNDLDIIRLLKQHFINTISSSTLINTSTPISSILSEFSDVSAIRNSTGKDKSNRRTSTPLQRKNLSNTAESFKQAFSGESDLSTVKNLSDEKNVSYNKNMKSS